MGTTQVQTHDGITDQLTSFLVDLRYDDISSPSVEMTKLYTLECLGHMVSAQSQRVSKLVVEYLKGIAAREEAIVVGAGFRSSMAEAAYANGTFAHADELESHGTLPGTGFVPPIAAAISVADGVAPTSGKDFIVAVVAGIEMQGRLGTAGIGACDRGFMGISLVGPGAAAVTAGRLLGLDFDQMRNCLGIALPMGNGSLRGCGYMTHVHEAGVPTRAGVFAAQMAAKGFTGCIDYLDGDYSWGEQYAGGANRPYRASALTERLGEELFIETCDVAPKQYGACGLTHQTLEGTIDLMREHRIEVDEIESIDLSVPPFADRVASFKEPVNGEQAKFSIVQGIAGLIVDGIPELPYVRPYGDDTCRDPRYVEALKRVRLHVQEGVPSQRGFTEQHVTINKSDGTSVSTTVTGHSVRGHADDPFTIGERLDMVRRTVESLGSFRTERLIDTVMTIEEREVSDVVDVLMG